MTNNELRYYSIRNFLVILYCSNHSSSNYLVSKFNVGAQIGVCYGQLGNDLPSPPEVIELYNQNYIQRMRLYAPNHHTFDAL